MKRCKNTGWHGMTLPANPDQKVPSMSLKSALTLSVALALTPLTSMAQNFGTPTVLTPVAVPSTLTGEDAALYLIEAYFDQTGPRDLFVIQLALNGSARGITLTTDGTWGPMTRAALLQDMRTYSDINGYGPTAGLRKIQDVPQFLGWVTAAAYANANPFTAEFPD